MSLILPVYVWKRGMARPKKSKQSGLGHKDPFEFNDTKGYRAKVVDFGAGGIKMELYRPRDVGPFWDRLAAVMLPPEYVDNFINWLSLTAGRPEQSLPPQTLGLLQALEQKIKKNEQIPKEDLKVLRRIIRSLQNIYSERSLAQRAYNR